MLGMLDVIVLGRGLLDRCIYPKNIQANSDHFEIHLKSCLVEI
jgi:hypothetical protein